MYCVGGSLNRIQIPGSHDAGSYSLSNPNGYLHVPPAQNGVAAPVYAPVGGSGYGHSSSLSAITQSYTLLDQLCLVSLYPIIFSQTHLY